MKVRTTLYDSLTWHTTGRDAQGRFSALAHGVVETKRGHWYRTDDARDAFHNDTVCRGCGRTGHFDYILDYLPCPKPATALQIHAALHGGAW
jgi:hypothetical protein